MRIFHSTRSILLVSRQFGRCGNVLGLVKNMKQMFGSIARLHQRSVTDLIVVPYGFHNSQSLVALPLTAGKYGAKYDTVGLGGEKQDDSVHRPICMIYHYLHRSGSESWRTQTQTIPVTNTPSGFLFTIAILSGFQWFFRPSLVQHTPVVNKN